MAGGIPKLVDAQSKNQYCQIQEDAKEKQGGTQEGNSHQKQEQQEGPATQQLGSATNEIHKVYN